MTRRSARSNASTVNVAAGMSAAWFMTPRNAAKTLLNSRQRLTWAVLCRVNFAGHSVICET